MIPNPSKIIAAIVVDAAKDLPPPARADVFDAFASLSSDDTITQHCRKAASNLREAEAAQLHLFALVKRP